MFLINSVKMYEDMGPIELLFCRFSYAGLDRLRYYDIELSAILHDIHGLKTSCSVISKVKRTKAEQQWKLEVIVSQSAKEVVLLVCHPRWVTN